MGICISENYNSPPTGGVLAIQTPTKSRPTDPENTWARQGFVLLCGGDELVRVDSGINVIASTRDTLS